MPQELLGDVLCTGDPGRARRRRFVLPISFAAHAAAAAAVLIVPLAAEVELPVPARPAQRVFHVVAVEPPPVIVRARGVQTAPAVRTAPSQAPSAIVDETLVPDQPLTTGVPGPPPLGPIGTSDGWSSDAMGKPGVVALLPPPEPRPPFVRPGGKIREPRKIVDVPPVYPPIAIAAQKEGVVMLEALLDENGNVTQLKVLRSEPLLDEAALQAVRRWRYTPTLLNGEPVPVLMTVTVHFRLR